MPRGLTKDDRDTLHRLSTLLHQEFSNISPASIRRFRRFNKLGHALDVLHEVMDELDRREQLGQGPLVPATRYSPPEDDDRE